MQLIICMQSVVAVLLQFQYNMYYNNSQYDFIHFQFNIKNPKIDNCYFKTIKKKSIALLLKR